MKNNYLIFVNISKDVVSLSNFPLILVGVLHVDTIQQSQDVLLSDKQRLIADIDDIRVHERVA